MARFGSCSWIAVLALAGCLGFGCSKSGTFVIVDFTGSPAPQGIKSIDLALTLGGKTAMTSYTAPGGGDITLPTSATLEIGSGSGLLLVAATARDKNGNGLFTAAAQGTVTTNETTTVSVQFGGSIGAGGRGGAGEGGLGGAGLGGSGGAGGGASAQLVADKSMYDFGTQVTTATGAAVGSTVVTVTNGGGQKTGTLTVSVVDSATFPTSADLCSGTTLDPGASCTVTVKFVPGTAGAKSSKLQVAATPGGTATVMLSGMGVDPGALTLSPDHGVFDPLQAGQMSAEQTFTVKNTGGAATTALTATLTGTSAGEFKVSTDHCTGKTLAGGDSCTVGVEFAPTQTGTPGTESAILSVSATAGGTTTATLSGTLLGPAAIAIVPTDQDFLMIVQGQTSPEYLFTVTNKGGVATGVLATGVTPQGEFSISSDGCSGQTLSPNDTCRVGIKMTPAGTGTRSASLTVRGSPGGAAVATLHGTGLAPGLIALSPQPGMFNIVDVGSPSTVPFTVTNTGGAPTTAITIGLSGDAEFTVASDGCTNMTLAAGATCAVRITFTPTTFGARTAMLTASATTGGTSTSTLTATGRDYVALNVRVGGTGNGTVSASGLACNGSSCTGNYPRTDPAAFQVVNLSATPDALSTFMGWGGACTGTGACVVTMGMAQSVTATFAIKQVHITGTIVNLSGQTGSLATDDGGFTCATGTCGPTTHNAQTTITLVATPGIGSSFIAWSNGPCKGVSPKCTIPLTSDVNVTATFGPPNYMFVTSSSVIPGRLGGIAGADAECAARATAAGLPGTYKAWINDNGVNASSRVGAGGWVRTDGRPFTSSLAALSIANQVVYYPPRVDENGNDLGPNRITVVTGGDNYGKNLGLQCAAASMPSWTTTNGGAYTGLAAAGSQYWAYNQLDSTACMDPSHLYCFRTDLASTTSVAITFPPANVRRIFISDLSVNPGGGLAAADAECQADAKAAGYTNFASFIALLATSKGSALARVNMTGATWMRPDQVLVVATPGDLATGNLISPIDVAADGVTYKNPPVWSGGVDAATVGDFTCKDWTSASSSDTGRYGYPNAAQNPDWFSSGTVACNQLHQNVICIEP